MKYQVAIYDGMDNEWTDIGEETDKATAQALWNNKTKNGTKNTHFDHIDYYAIWAIHSNGKPSHIVPGK